MPCLDPETLALILETVRALGRSLITPERSLAWDEREELPGEVMETLLGPEVGLHLLFMPESVGGLGGGAMDLCRLSEALGRLDLGVATAFLAVALGCDPLRVGGTEEQRRRWLGKVADEGLIVAYAVTEPEAGSNVAALRTTATPVMDGERVAAYRLEGTKQFITNGATARLYTVLAAAPAGPSFFVVERGAPGLEVGKAEQKHGIRASNTTQVVLDGVEVPADQLVGMTEGLGLKQANRVFGYTRVMVASMALGAGEEALSRAAAYSRERVQFNRPLNQHRGYTHKLLVPHRARLSASRAYLEQVCARMDAGEEGLQAEGSMAKLFTSEAANAAAEGAIQALGGYGYTREYMVEKIKRDVRITTIYEGTSEIQQGIIYLDRYKRTRRSKGAFYLEMAAKARSLGDDVGGGDLAGCAQELARALPELSRRKLSRQQHVQFALADRCTALEHALALGRAAKDGSEQMQALSRLLAAETAADQARTMALIQRDLSEELDLVAGWITEE